MVEGRYEEAVAYMEKAIAIAPTLGHYYCRLSDIFIKTREYNKALSLWDRVADIQLDHTDDNTSFINHWREHVVSEQRRDEGIMAAAEIVIPFIAQHPGFIQKDICKVYSNIDRDYISTALYYMSKGGLVLREKKGSSYTLKLNGTAEMVLSIWRGLNRPY